MDEPDWALSDIADNFYQNFPADTSFAETKTEVRIIFDETNIYIAAICHDKLRGDYVVQSLKRDFLTRYRMLLLYS